LDNLNTIAGGIPGEPSPPTKRGRQLMPDGSMGGELLQGRGQIIDDDGEMGVWVPRLFTLGEVKLSEW
jgi:hypothetical protein